MEDLVVNFVKQDAISPYLATMISAFLTRILLGMVMPQSLFLLKTPRLFSLIVLFLGLVILSPSYSGESLSILVGFFALELLPRKKKKGKKNAY